MTKITCDYCGREINPNKKEFTGDLDDSNLAVIKVEPLLLNQTTSKINNPDLCRECIIKVLKD